MVEEMCSEGEGAKIRCGSGHDQRMGGKRNPSGEELYPGIYVSSPS